MKKRKSKKGSPWLTVTLTVTLAVLLATLVLVVLLPAEPELPFTPQSSGEAQMAKLAARSVTVVAEVSPAVEPESQAYQAASREEDEHGFAFEELAEVKKLQAPKEVDVAIHNGYPESGIALVMDDVGYDLRALKRILALPFPVAISILPDGPSAIESADMAHAAGSVVMLHLPMEPTTPKYRARMSDSFLQGNMSEAQIRQRFDLALQRVPHVTGVNNHMGSLLTALAEPMGWVMEMCKERSLFFVDSKTSQNSVAADIAAKQGVVWGARKIFLDHTVDAEDLSAAWRSALRCAKRQGSCIVIAHPHAETLHFLERQVDAKDYRWIRPVTSMLHKGDNS